MNSDIFTFVAKAFRKAGKDAFGIRRTKEENMELYCHNQVFIIIMITKFPIVEIQLVDGRELLNRFPGGRCRTKVMREFLLEKRREFVD